MTRSKILILIPDGVSLRNFVFSGFYEKAKVNGFEVVFLNNTAFDLSALGYQERSLGRRKLHWLTDSFKNAKKRVELNLYKKQFNDEVYEKYWFKLRNKTVKTTVKNLISKLLILFFNSEKGLLFLRKKIKELESKTDYYKESVKLIEKEKPDVVYCASQRSVLAIAPIEAAKSLGLPTVCFIYSWDNLPKSMLDVETHYYYVWSHHMKTELLKYYPFVNKNQIVVTGTPQFELHLEESFLLSKKEFYETYNLDTSKDYFCFSGDDVTTSPQDPLYLRDFAEAIRELNKKGQTLGVIFRRCPVDFSDRYDYVLEEYKELIVPIDPVWKVYGNAWDSKMPTKEDSVLLSNIAHHCVGVVNLGSTMAFDFALHGNPCAYINYHYLNDGIAHEKGVHVYEFVHFRSMPQKTSVVWLNSPDEISSQVYEMLNVKSRSIVLSTMQWLNIVTEQPIATTSDRILNALAELIQK
ncbi:MAG: UDP-glycosyltransferase [Ignavibacteriae bacterium]|nr:UDP-glycosyltransferase [Ignavibacteriota bacterium]